MDAKNIAPPPDTPPLPADVSPVYQKLRVYVFNDEKYRSESNSVKLAIFALAYSDYSQNKKKQINHLLKIDNNANRPEVKMAFLQFDDTDSFAVFCQRAKVLLRGYVEDDIRELIEKTSKSLQPGFWKHAWAEVGATVFVAFCLALLPAILTVGSLFLHDHNGTLWLNHLGRWLIKTFPTS